MGKSRKKTSKQTTADTPKSIHNDTLYKIGNILSHILDTGRESPLSSSNRASLSKRRRFVESADDLSRALEKYNGGAEDEGRGPSSGVLVGVESAASKVRITCDAFLSGLDSERTDVLRLRLELSLHHGGGFLFPLSCGGVNATQAVILGRVLCSRYLTQIEFDARVARSVLSLLSDIYQDGFGGGSGYPLRLRTWAEGIRERAVLDRLMWEDIRLPIVEVRKGDKEEVDDTDVIDGSEFDPPSSILGGKRAEEFEDVILAAPSIQAAVSEFVKGPEVSDDGEVWCSLFLLLVGDSGCGKSHICDEIQRRVSSQTSLVDGHDDCCSFTVIRPTLPSDIMGKTVGSSENLVVSIFSQAVCSSLSNKTVLILDGMEHILSTARTRACFISIHHDIQSKGPGQLLVIATARSATDALSDRFDKVYTIKDPNSQMRRRLIASTLSPYPTPHPFLESHALTDNALSHLVDSTVGRSAAEIAQHCREAIMEHDVDQTNHNADLFVIWKGRLEQMNRSLQTCPPQSTRNGLLDGIVSVDVITSKELLKNASHLNNHTQSIPLFGKQAMRAWDQLRSLIVVPLCRSHRLAKLLHNTDNPKSTFSPSVLITGPHGSGKTALARHCAAVVASILPSVRLLDVSCTSLIHKQLGASERAVHQMFNAARSAAPCILLLDGIEAIAPPRGNDNTTEGTMDRVLSTFLTEMDGIGEGDATRNSHHNVVAIIGITHDPDLIDSALRRPGRLEKCVRLQHPDSITRSLIVKKELEGLPLDFSEATFFQPKNEQLLADYISLQTEGRSAAQVISVCTEAAMICVREFVEESPQVQTSCQDDMTMRPDHFISSLKFGSNISSVPQSS